MEIYEVLPTIGRFKLVINPYYGRNGDLIYKTLKLGGSGKGDGCLDITIPNGSGDAILLSWVSPSKKCTLDDLKIKGDATRQMVLLGISIARELAPHATHILLDDMSHIECDSPGGNDTIKMSLPLFYIAFHGKTWYEDKFGAVLNNPILRERYNKYISNLDDPSKKPLNFRFNNDELQEILDPLYNNADTWKEFFQMIAKKYGNKRCIILKTWVNSAMSIIFEGDDLYAGKKWRIDINERNTPTINYYQIKPTTYIGGGIKRSENDDRYVHLIPDFIQSYELKFKGFR
jgi:hypothetical protein